MGNRRIVLVLTGSDDPTADAVIAELDRRAAAVSRFDLGDFPTEAHMSATHNGDGWRGAIVGPGGTVALEQIRAVYYRRPSRFRFPDGLSVADRAYAEAEARIGIGGVLAALDCPWVSHPHDVARAEWKPLQLQVAARIGLAIPRTIISNDVGTVRDFARSAAGPVVCKPLSGIKHYAQAGKTHITYTTIVDPDSIDPDAFALTAHLVQEWVPKQREARITVAGSAILATAIEAESMRAYIDWRTDYANLRYEPIDVPADISDKLIRYLAAFRLRFGAFDFVITPSGEWVMLECNPTGQWLWIHHKAGLPIPAAIADLLTEDHS